MMSMVLPGGKGMTILIGFEGQGCASGAEANPRANAASTTTRSCLILALLTLQIGCAQATLTRAAKSVTGSPADHRFRCKGLPTTVANDLTTSLGRMLLSFIAVSCCVASAYSSRTAT